MKKEEKKIIKKVLKKHLVMLNIKIKFPWDNEGREISDKKYLNLIKEKDICKILLKKLTT